MQRTGKALDICQGRCCSSAGSRCLSGLHWPCISAFLHFPEWADWFLAELNLRKKVQPLMGFGYRAIAMKTNRQELLKLIEHGIRKTKLAFPVNSGPVQ